MSDLEELKEINKKLEQENNTLKEQLKKYTANAGHKKYYDTNKEKISAQKKEYYLKKKELKN